MPTSQPKDVWDKLLVLATLMASILVPLAIAIVGNSYSSAMKESENRIRYVELAIGVLRTDPTPDGAALRAWSIEVVNKNATVPLDKAAQQELLGKKLMVKYPTYDAGTTYPDGTTFEGKVACRQGDKRCKPAVP